MIYLSVKDAAQLENVSERTMQRHIKSGKLDCREVKSNIGQGGKTYEICLISLSKQAVSRYYAENKIDVPAVQEKTADGLADTPEYNRKKAYKYLRLLQTAEGMKGDDLKKFLAECQRQNGISCSYSAFLREKKKFRTLGAAALTARYGCRAGDTTVDDECFDYFKRHYLVERGRSAEEVYRQTVGYARKELGLDIDEGFASLSSFLRRLHREIGKAGIYLARFGQAAFNRKYGDYVERYMNMPAGAVWVSDHMQADVLVYPDGAPAAAREDLKNLFAFRAQGKPARPWITVWRDMRTSKWLGWIIHIEPPNTDHIMAAMYNAMTTWGIPRAIYIDNGKDYRSRDFTGGRRVHRLEADELRIGGMAGALGIKTFFALPYNAQSKPVERDFKNWHAWIDRALPGYTGSNTSEKPEKLRRELASGSIITIHEFCEIAELYIDAIICGQSSKGKALQGRSPNEAFQQEFEGLRLIDAEELKLWCMRSSSVQELRRNGWRDPDLGWFYYAEWMNGYKGQRVYMRRDPKKYQIGWFFLESTDEYIGHGILTAPTPGIAETDLEREQLAEAMRRKKRANKALKSLAEVGSPDDVMAQAVHRMAANKVREVGNNYVPAANEVVITRMAAVVKKAETEKTGTYDEAPKGKIVLFRNSLDDND